MNVSTLRFVLAVCLIALAGCSGSANPPEPAPNHPASPSAPESPSDRAPSETTTYVCPMHPEVTATAPGSCPKCGMALEAKAGREDHSGHHHSH